MEEIARAIVQLTQNDGLRQELARKGLAQYRHFTWQKTAEKTAIYLAEAYARRKVHGGKETTRVRREGVVA